MSKLLVVAVATAALLAGCNAAPINAPAGGALGAMAQAAANNTVPVSGAVEVSGPSGYRLTALTAWAKADIHHVTLTLLKDDGTGTFAATGATKTVAGADLASAVNLGNLKMASRYKLSARAYADAAGTQAIDNVDETGSDADCSVVFTTPSLVSAGTGDNIDDATKAVTIPVRLEDKTFAGTAASGGGVAVTNGTIVNTAASETF